MREEKHYCDVCGSECEKYKLFDIGFQLTERTNSNLQGDRTIVRKEICKKCLEEEGIIPTNKVTYETFGLKKYDNENDNKSVLKLIKKWFKF